MISKSLIEKTISLFSCPDPSARAALKLVCDLYALDRIWKDIGTYRNVDYVAPNKAKVGLLYNPQIIYFVLCLVITIFVHFFCMQAIHKLTEYLSFQVRNVAKELVDAFDLPDEVTRAPIAMQSDAYAQYTQVVGF